VHKYKPPPIQRHQIVSVLQRFDGEIGRTISDVQKRDEQTDKRTDKQTNRQKLNVFGHPAAGEIRSHQTWHGDRVPQARSCTSKTFGDLTHSFAAKGSLKISG